MSQLILRNLSCGYDGKAVVENLSLSIGAGDYLCVVGDNGAGKSTLLKTVLGIQKPLKGEIVLDGVTRKEFGYLPQQKDVSKDFPASAYEIVLSGFAAKLGFRPFYKKAEKAAATENMEKLGIQNLSKRCYRELSGGQQRRVLLARALCAAQKVIFLDEPSAGLDPETTEQMYAIIETLNRERGVSVVAVTHDTAAVARYASHVLRLDKTPYFFGAKDEFINKTEDGA